MLQSVGGGAKCMEQLSKISQAFTIEIKFMYLCFSLLVNSQNFATIIFSKFGS